MAKGDRTPYFDHNGRVPRDTWRVQGDHAGRFDEIVVGHFLHAEMMHDGACWIQVCGHCFWVKIDRNGYGAITLTEDRSADPAYSGKSATREKTK